MRILITGATGFIGTALIDNFLRKNDRFELLCCVRDVDKACLKLGVHETIRYCLLSDAETIMAFNPEIAVHLAAFNTSKEGPAEIHSLVDSNIEYGLMLLDVLTKCDNFKLFINTGSFSQFCNGGDAYLYSASKSAFEIFLKYYSKKYDWKYINVIPYTVYGGEKTVKRLIDYIIESLDSPLPVAMTEGEQMLDFIHVNDVAAFYISAIKNHESIKSGQIFHIGTGISTSVRKLAGLIENITGKKCNITWGGINYRDNDIMFANAPIQLLRDSIWRPEYNLRKGLEEYLRES